MDKYYWSDPTPKEDVLFMAGEMSPTCLTILVILYYSDLGSTAINVISTAMYIPGVHCYC